MDGAMRRGKVAVGFPPDTLSPQTQPGCLMSTADDLELEPAV